MLPPLLVSKSCRRLSQWLKELSVGRRVNRHFSHLRKSQPVARTIRLYNRQEALGVPQKRNHSGQRRLSLQHLITPTHIRYIQYLFDYVGGQSEFSTTALGHKHGV
jgi:hypothetical protein